MKRPIDLATSTLSFVAVVLLAAWAGFPAHAQQQAAGAENQSDMGYLEQPVVEDWSSRHVAFSNPGTLEDARRNGKEAEWQRIVTNPRYRMQWVKEYGAGAGLRATQEADISYVPGFEQQDRTDEDMQGNGEHRKRDSIRGDWSVMLGATGTGVPFDQYPAKFTFALIGPPNCTNDYVVFPVANSTSTGANVIGVNNLYSGTCSGTVPAVLFAYNVGTGSVQTSPVISLDGTKVAFVESLSTGSYFHVLTLDKSGNSGCANPVSSSTTPCNGTAYNTAALPCTQTTITTASNGTATVSTTTQCTYNSAVDTRIAIYPNGATNGLTVSRSSPFVNYSGDYAFIGDDNGNLHEFNPVFKSSPREIVTSGMWPACTGTFAPGGYCSAGFPYNSPGPMLSSPVYDSTSGLVIVGGSNGLLFATPYNVGGSTSYGFVSNAQSVGTTILDAPIVDSTTEKVFAASTNSSNLVLSQYGISSSSSKGWVSGSAKTATMGATGTDAYDGAFDHVYLSSAAHTGYMYFCGNISGAGTPALLRVVITAGVMTAGNDGNSFPLVPSGNTGTSYDCTPLTEFYNSVAGIDYLFVGVKNKGGPSGCGATTCIMSFSLPTTTPYTFPTGIFAATSVSASTTTPASNGVSGFIIDNASLASGASQIYFGDPYAGTGVQASQSGLH